MSIRLLLCSFSRDIQFDLYAENSRIEENHMEKAKFTFSDGSGADEFFVLEETKINGSRIFL